MTILSTSENVTLNFGGGTAQVFAHDSENISICISSGGISANAHLKPEAAEVLGCALIASAQAVRDSQAVSA